MHISPAQETCAAFPEYHLKLTCSAHLFYASQISPCGNYVIGQYFPISMQDTLENQIFDLVIQLNMENNDSKHHSFSIKK